MVYITLQPEFFLLALLCMKTPSYGRNPIWTFFSFFPPLYFANVVEFSVAQSDPCKLSKRKKCNGYTRQGLDVNLNQ